MGHNVRVQPHLLPRSCGNRHCPTCRSHAFCVDQMLKSGSAIQDVSTTMIYTHVLNKGGRGVCSALDAA